MAQWLGRRMSDQGVLSSSLKNCIERLCLKVESSFLNKLQKMFVHKGGTVPS